MIEYIQLEGTRSAGKLARSVRSRGKAGDHIKCLPIATDSLIQNQKVDNP
jgi:hypothetical protein